MWNFEFGFRSDLEFTFWVALLAVPFQNLTAFGVDQLNAQRMFCCRDAKTAGKALIFSCFGQLLTVLMLLVGAALFVHYYQHPFTSTEAETLKASAKTIAGQTVMLPADSEAATVFPMWIVTQLPAGVSGLLLAGVFAASISSLDSILAALSQTTLSALYHPETRSDSELQGLDLLAKSRMLVIAWGILLTGFTELLNVAREGIPILQLAFGMTAYTMGPLLGLMLCAIVGRASFRGLLLGTALSLAIVALVRTDLWVLWIKAGLPWHWLASLPSYEINEAGDGIKALWAFPWAWPLTTAITFLAGWLPARAKSGSHS